jgi:universal stress protein E
MTTTSTNSRPIRSIVVGTDFSHCSAIALRQASRIGQWPGAKVHAVHVIDTTVVIDVETALSPMQQGIRENLMKDAQQAWRSFSSSIPGAAELSFEVSINNRIAGILHSAQAHKAELLVMGAFGDHRLDVGVGTIATACVRNSPADALLVRESQDGPFKTIVAAVDLSPTSLRALDRAAQFAANDGSALHILHVYSAPGQGLRALATSAAVQAAHAAKHREGVERRFNEVVRAAVVSHPRLRVAPVPAFREAAGRHSGIVDYARTVSADLIVLGTHGHTSLRDLLMGSTAEKALRETACSILAVKPEGFVSPISGGH